MSAGEFGGEELAPAGVGRDLQGPPSVLSRLVVGVDFSENSRAALIEGARLALAAALPLEVFTVVPAEVEEALAQTAEQGRPLREVAIENLRQWSEELLGEGAKPEIGYQARVGDPYEELALQCAGVAAANTLLVVGSRGSQSEAGQAGLVASRCVRRGETPVLLVRRAAEAAGKIGRVIVGWDESEAARVALDWAVALARLEGAELVLAHIQIPILLPDGMGLGTYLPPVDQTLIVDATRARLERELAALPLAWPTHWRVEVITEASVVAGLAYFARGDAHDLLVVGTHGRRGWRRLLLGTTAEHLIHDSPSSVLVVKGPQPESAQVGHAGLG